MKLIADTHCHIYDCYNLNSLITSAFKNFAALEIPGPKLNALFLTQSVKGSPSTREIVDGIAKASNFSVQRIGGVLEVQNQVGEKLYVVAGRQFISAEKIEVLGLCYEGVILDGLSASEIVAKLNSEDGVVVLPWSPGKWRGERGAIIRGLIDKFSGHEIMLGDILMRACGEPDLFKLAREKSINVISGSDALPLPGEEMNMARYVTVIDVVADFLPDMKNFKEALYSAPYACSGARNNYFEAVKRWLRLYMAKFE